MDDNRILIAEDDEASRSLLCTLTSSMGLAPVTAENGREAIELFMKTPFPLVITDLEMPEMDGSELVSRLKDTEADPVVIVQTVHADPARIIEVMRKGVYDYITKPLIIDDFRIKLERAFETASMRRMKRQLEKERTVRLEHELDWYKWSESHAGHEAAHRGKSLFHSLHTAFNQGAGFGALVTLLDLLSSTAKKEDGRYTVDSELMELASKNVKHSHQILKTFADIDSLVSRDLELVESTCGGVYDILASIKKEMGRYAALKRQSIALSDKKEGFDRRNLSIDRGYLIKAFSEGIINACKFSEPDSRIYILMDTPGEAMSVSIVSRPWMDEQKRTGIPLGYENIVFEPFFRMTKAVFEGYDTMDYGLGLTLVEKIARRHGGKATISNIEDHSDMRRDPVTKVSLRITVPLASGRGGAGGAA
jgi:CheY-like chemotaxis protein